jgi:hypothetical protein
MLIINNDIEAVAIQLWSKKPRKKLKVYLIMLNPSTKNLRLGDRVDLIDTRAAMAMGAMIGIILVTEHLVVDMTAITMANMEATATGMPMDKVTITKTLTVLQKAARSRPKWMLANLITPSSGKHTMSSFKANKSQRGKVRKAKGRTHTLLMVVTRRIWIGINNTIKLNMPQTRVLLQFLLQTALSLHRHQVKTMQHLHLHLHHLVPQVALIILMSLLHQACKRSHSSHHASGGKDQGWVLYCFWLNERCYSYAIA